MKRAESSTFSNDLVNNEHKVRFVIKNFFLNLTKEDVMLIHCVTLGVKMNSYPRITNHQASGDLERERERGNSAV
jgi:hypothetical protein